MPWFWKRQKQPEASPGNGMSQPLVGFLSDPGCHRELNEDSVLVVSVAEKEHPGRGLLAVVADGMGGHKAGEVASQTAVQTIEAEYPRAKGSPREALEKAFRKANEAIARLSAEHPEMAGMGTTCTALALVGSELWAAHVGDSRLYLIRDGNIYQLSEDHTQCMEMVRKGLLTLEQARHHEERNVLVRAMGTRPELDLMLWPEPMAVRAGDRFVLCSDGLHDLVAPEEIRELAESASPADACRQLVKMARERGGYDNITVAVVATPAAAPAEETKIAATREIEVKQ